jgi:hypothetical protein
MRRPCARPPGATPCQRFRHHQFLLGRRELPPIERWRQCHHHARESAHGCREHAVWRTSAVPTTGISAGDLLDRDADARGRPPAPTNTSRSSVPQVRSPAARSRCKGRRLQRCAAATPTPSRTASGSTFQVIRVPQTLNATLSGNYSSARPGTSMPRAMAPAACSRSMSRSRRAWAARSMWSGQGFRGGAAFNLTGNAAD